MTTKQVIVMRKDLNMRKGKMVAQGSHASLAVILKLMEPDPRVAGFVRMMDTRYMDVDLLIPWVLDFQTKPYVKEWLDNSFRKIVVGVDNRAELLGVYGKAKIKEIPCSLIKDKGDTEFHGVPTYTCCAIGPDLDERIDKITDNLKLL